MMIALMIVHVILINVDDHFFNQKRRITRHEVFSTITDGVFFLLPLLMATFISYQKDYELIYKVIAGISMISIVKNEYFYNNLCVRERLLHAALYVLHPMILFTFFESWQNNYFDNHPNFWMIQLAYIFFGIKTVTYQIIYYNYIHHNESIEPKN